MKKLVSLMALCTVLLGAVALVGCGTKPAKGSVWKITKTFQEGFSGAEAYYCFHSDGNVYLASRSKNVLGALHYGTYTIGSKTITINGQSISYTLKGDKMTFKYVGSALEEEMQKVSSPTEDEIKKAVVKQ